ncbi:tRNA (uridine(34)/cytosine(34)/5-carboxymethylaminomethyluridine(34)-2'-O)-methyltransferase TrmL [Desulfallas sp. Bu1-1]|uniref:tRNA (uridine(34)/cytosine(34)/5- carboxymethylaminomethyluridine(34)-2'-O)- methyltransferase TrmL n=1 Tax=Desulfallas sp. Bu1-1 TaxID=2787620 RepID=UPI00189CF44F|nr:tRNA (uridine(34)/cytosine(34)/5-carboxymethylaminomethyluridine(34)-2'-O)-methyltransferase TrmL [Desulfallas sp. Bu1-1]MBF7081900.1 tRNA (uridine(34)/cytosine(34)/5-carboxymethylaminomethyluridine(34)-2'-O)-methyltransferase TrmL [Desulfallas sp. Bu1-1]
MHLVLVEPEIPANTGNVARTCAVTGAELHLVKPLGFSVDDKHLKRAGLDYWHLLTIHYHDSFEEILAAYPGHRFHFATTRAIKKYTDVKYGLDDFLVFGKETAGLPDRIINRFWDRCIRIPMINDARSLNLSNSVAVVLYEALRQNGFAGLK